MHSIKEQSGWRFKTSICFNYRGRCSFDDKIRSAQSAGFKAAIIYDSVDGAPLIERGTQQAVFISKASGKLLKKHADRTEVELWILPTFENYPWSIMAVSFISLHAMSAVLATCFFVCKHHVRHERPRGPRVPELHGMSRHDIHNCFGRQLYFKNMCYLSGRL